MFIQVFLCILNYTKAIYNIGTELLNFQCFLTTDMFLFSKSIIPEDSKILDRYLGHVLWKLKILSDPGENLHAALDWEVTLLAKKPPEGD